MRGVITTKDVFLHSFTIVRLFGVGTWLDCLRAVISRKGTFLGALYPAAVRTSTRRT